MKSGIIFVYLILFAGCKNQKNEQFIVELEGRMIVGLPPSDDVDIKCVGVGDDVSQFEFEASPVVITKWLHEWPVSRERYRSSEYEDFHREIFRLIDAKKEVELFYDEKRTYKFKSGPKHYLVTVSVFVLSADMWKVAIRIGSSTG